MAVRLSCQPENVDTSNPSSPHMADAYLSPCIRFKTLPVLEATLCGPSNAEPTALMRYFPNLLSRVPKPITMAMSFG